MAAGVVTVKAFTHDSSDPTQENDGFFVRLTTTLSSVVFPSQPNSRGAANNFGEVAVEHETWTPRRTLLFSDLDDIDYEDASVMYDALTHRSFFTGSMIESVASRRAGWGYSPLHGYTYSVPLYKFEFGRIEQGSCNPAQATYMRWHQRLGGDSFQLTLGVHSRSAYATIAAGTSSPPVLYAFTPIIFNNDAPADVDHRQQIDFVQKSPCRFRVSSDASSQTVNMPYVTVGGTYAQATGAAIAHPVSPVDGRDIADITAVSASRTNAAIQANKEYADLWTYQQPITPAAAGESVYRGVWPAFQPQTDIAIPIGSARQESLQSARINVTISSSSVAANRQAGGIGVSSACLGLPGFLTSLSTESPGGEDADKQDVRIGEIPYLDPQLIANREASLTVGPASRQEDGGALGDFGTLNLAFEQKDCFGNQCVGEWHARNSSGGSRSVNTTTARGQIKTYRLSVAIVSASYWQESPWSQMEARARWELSKSTDVPESERGVPPGLIGRWNSDKQAFFQRQISMFNLLCDSARFVSGTMSTSLKSCEGIGYFGSYGRSGLSGGLTSVSFPASTVEQRLKFTSRTRPDVRYWDKSLVPDGSAAKALPEAFFASIWANTETTRNCDVWKVGNTRTTTRDEFVATDIITNWGEGGGAFGNFFGNTVATYAPSFRVAWVNCFFDTWSDSVASFTTKTHNRLTMLGGGDEAIVLHTSGDDMEFIGHNGDATARVSGITASW
ncbi:MAG: hypothetical protein EBR82_25205 [Caulobacteraceae bacterium]|nr:hypothetical protein [Caulobacteraceae bacterium]